MSWQGDSQTEAFRCIEMQEKRAWGFGIDAYGICGTVHCLLFGEYMQTEKTIDADGTGHSAMLTCAWLD